MSQRSDEDFREEIESHLALEADRLKAAEGLSATEAAEKAQRTFGNVTHARERFYESARTIWWEQLRHDLAYALRGLRHRPGFALTALLTIGLGIGVNTAIFTLFYSLLARPLPVADPGSLYHVYQQFSGNVSRRVDGMASLLAWPEYQEYLKGNRSFSGMAAYGDVRLAFQGARDGTALGQLVSCNYFQVLGTAIPMGRGFGADECTEQGSAPVAVISHQLWRNAFAGDSAIIGQTIELNKARLTIVGVSDRGFGGIGLEAADVWIPMLQQPLVDRERDSLLPSETSWLYVIGRLEPGRTLNDVRRELAPVARAMDERHAGRITEIVLERGALFNAPEIHREGSIVGGAISVIGLLVLVIICANLMNLLLARGIARRREIAIRLALGGSRGRLVMQLITESLVIAFVGGMIGLLLAATLPKALLSILPAQQIQLDLSLDPAIFAFALLLSTLTALAFGLLPALHATRMQLATAMKGGSSRGEGGHHPGRLRAVIVSVQIACSSCLVILSGVLLRSANRQASLDPGYDPSGVVSVSLNLPMLGYDSTRARALYDELTSRLGATPGIEQVALAEMLPLLSRHGEPARPMDGEERSIQSDWNVVSAGYLPLMKIRLVSGRLFTDAEVGHGGERPAIVAQRLAQMLWPGEDAIGRAFVSHDVQYRVVGIAADVSHVSLMERPGPFGYIPVSPSDPRGMQIILRTRGDASTIERDVREVTRQLDPAITVKAERLDERMKVALLPTQISSLVSSALGALALLLAMVGVYGVVAYGVSQRRQEIAVRLALGAEGRQVVQRMMRIGLPAAASGLTIGFLMALGIAQVLRSLITDIPVFDLVPFLLVSLGLAGIVALATWLPAREAARVQPARVLRVEE
jgi:predicted permease